MIRKSTMGMAKPIRFNHAKRGRRTPTEIMQRKWRNEKKERKTRSENKCLRKQKRMKEGRKGQTFLGKQVKIKGR